MSFFKDLFKRKPGGTFVGNLIRGVANKASYGLLGNGLFKLKEGESPDESNENAKDAIAQGVAYTNKVAGTDGAQKDVFFMYLKQYWYYVAVPFGVVVLYLMSRNKSNRRRY